MIVVFGSNVLDQFMMVENMPEADQAIHLDSHVEAPGGKGQNQAVAAAKAGADVRFYGAVGSGGHGRAMIRNLETHNIDASGIDVVDEPTGMAVICVNERDGTHRIIVSQGANRLAQQASVPDTVLTPATTLLLQAELDLKQTRLLMDRARAHGCRRVMMNLAPFKPLADADISALDYLVMNEHEADGLISHLKWQGQGYEDFARFLKKTYGVNAIVTLGPDGVVAFDGETLWRLPAPKIKAVDTVGAGDAFCGFMAAWLDAGFDFKAALTAAVYAGSIACTKIGAQAALPEKAEVLGAIHAGLVKAA
jgi:ribokinase